MLLNDFLKREMIFFHYYFMLKLFYYYFMLKLISINTILKNIMNTNQRFSICGTLRKQDCIELLKNNLTFEELNAILKPNYNQLMRLIKSYTKKENQFLLYNTHKIGLDKITAIIRQNSVIGVVENEEELNEDFSADNTNGTKSNLNKPETFLINCEVDKEENVKDNVINETEIFPVMNIEPIIKQLPLIQTPIIQEKPLIEVRKNIIKPINNEASNNIKKIDTIHANDNIQAKHIKALEFMKTINFNKLKDYTTLESITREIKSNNNNFNKAEINYIILQLAKYHKEKILSQTTLSNLVRDDINRLISPEDIYERINDY